MLCSMGQAMRSVSQNPFGLTLPPDVVGAAIERLNDIVLVTETEPFEEPGPRIVYVNPAFERITGYTSAEAVGRSPRFLRGPGTSMSELDRVEEAMRAKKPVRSELLNYRKDGTPFWVEMDVTIVSSPSSGGEYFVCIERETTRRRKAEVALIDYQRSMGSLLSNLPGMAYRRRDDGLWTMEFVSGGCAGLTGYPADAFMGDRSVSYEGLIEPEDRKRRSATTSRTPLSAAMRSSSPTGSGPATAGSSGSGSEGGPSPGWRAASGSSTASSPTSPSRSSLRTRSCRASASRASGP
jgi:PAS domain S-box-containing protein